MRFLRIGLPRVSRVVLVESGSRHLSDGVIPYLRRYFGENIQIDLVTCYTGLPAGLHPDSTSVYHVHSYRGRDGRKRLYAELRARKPAVLVIVCSGEPIMTKWKWALAFRLPAKVLIVNENSDHFWCDRASWRVIRRFAAVRAGLSGADAVRTVGQVLLFPFTLTYLLLYAAMIHLRRKVHL